MQQRLGLADIGLITQSEVAQHRLRHVLTSVLGGSADQVDVNIHRFTLRDADRLLLCTNGLTDMVPDPQIAEVLRDARPPGEACQSPCHFFNSAWTSSCFGASAAEGAQNAVAVATAAIKDRITQLLLRPNVSFARPAGRPAFRRSRRVRRTPEPATAVTTNSDPGSGIGVNVRNTSFPTDDS